MKILIIVNTSWNIYNFRKDLLISLIKKGHDVIAIAPYDDYVKNIEALGIKCINIKINQQGTNPFSDSFLIYNYFKIFKNKKPDLILGYTIKPNLYGNIAAGILKIPVINNISGLGTIFIKNNFISYIGIFLYKFSLRFSSHVFFQNQFDRELFLSKNLISSNKSSVIPGSGVDVNYFNFNRKVNKGKRFLFVGRLLKDKGVIEYFESALRVVKIFPKTEFLLVGELGYNNKTAIKNSLLKSYIEKSNQIKYIGKLDDLRPLYESIDVMVLPSYREGLSKSLIEAGAMSLPIITSNVPGCKDVVEDSHNGYLCDVKSIDSLTNKISKIINDSENKRVLMGENSRDYIVKNFSLKKVINIYLKKINEIGVDYGQKM